MKKSFSIAATALLLVAPVAAFADGADQFTHDGVVYSYTTKVSAGERVIRGTATGRMPFELHVRKNTVSGTFDNHPVQFSLNNVRKLGIAIAAK